MKLVFGKPVHCLSRNSKLRSLQLALGNGNVHSKFSRLGLVEPSLWLCLPRVRGRVKLDLDGEAGRTEWTSRSRSDQMLLGQRLVLTADQLGIVVPELETAMDAYVVNCGVRFQVFDVDDTLSQFSGSTRRFRVRFGLGQDECWARKAR